MSLYTTLNIVSSAMNAQTKKINTCAENLANSETFIYENGKYLPYQAKKVVMKFNCFDKRNKLIGGIKSKVVESKEKKGKLIYNPDHIFASKDGFVNYPNIDVISENINAMEAVRSYESNISLLNTIKSMILQTLSIGK
ncbi:flagellar basal body rod protein FlgC [Buchnera aphidicola (Kurisakia onigurumii)]|uniref:flagellar basal body rod protein FlgC n=1 Tax=Buchnera aphidicola TaxID=9 RepID=UPI0031B6893B